MKFLRKFLKDLIELLTMEAHVPIDGDARKETTNDPLHQNDHGYL